PGATTNSDLITDSQSGVDTLQLDASAMPALGAAGRLAAGDARFVSGPGLNSGQDSSDRLVYDTSHGILWYDADGSGPGQAQLVFSFQGVPALAATDIVITGQPASTTIQGTEGDDTLTGTPGNDTIDGRGGNNLITCPHGTDSPF